MRNIPMGRSRRERTDLRRRYDFLVKGTQDTVPRAIVFAATQTGLEVMCLCAASRADGSGADAALILAEGHVAEVQHLQESRNRSDFVAFRVGDQLPQDQVVGLTPGADPGNGGLAIRLVETAAERLAVDGDQPSAAGIRMTQIGKGQRRPKRFSLRRPR